jgi:hypothetical protein
MSRTWKDNAAEFAALDLGEGWPFAILVACSVEKGAGQGTPPVNRPEAKVSATAFAEVAGTSHKRVLRYLEAWERAVADGVVPDASTLTPEDAHHVTIPDAQFGGKGGYYDGSAQGGGLPTDRVQATKAETLVDKMTPEQRVEVAEAIMEKVPYTDLPYLIEKAEDRHETESALTALVNGAQPVPPLGTYQPKQDALDGIMDGGMAEADLLDAMERVVTLARRVGHLAADHPTALRMQTMWMEVSSFYVEVRDDARRMD